MPVTPLYTIQVIMQNLMNKINMKINEKKVDCEESDTDYQRLWRALRLEIQDVISSKTPVKTLRLVVLEKWFKGEIQDEIIFLRQCGCGFFHYWGGDGR